MAFKPRRFVIPTALVLVGLLLGLSACGLLREPVPATQPAPNATLPIVHVTAAQATQAMQQDEFFSQYGLTTLLVQGTVVSAQPQPDGHLIVALDGSGQRQVLCDLATGSQNIQVGSTVTVESAFPQRDAVRQGANVLIHNCTIP